MKKQGWSEEGLMGKISHGEDHISVGRFTYTERSVHTQHHTSASTLWKRPGHFLCTETVVSYVNFTLGHALNHRQFQTFLEEI